MPAVGSEIVTEGCRTH